MILPSSFLSEETACDYEGWCIFRESEAVWKTGHYDLKIGPGHLIGPTTVSKILDEGSTPLSALGYQIPYAST